MAQPPANVNNYGYSPAAPTPPEPVQPNFAPQQPMAPAPSAPPPPNYSPQPPMAPAPAAPPPPNFAPQQPMAPFPATPPPPMAQPPNYNPYPYGQPNPYGQAPPPYTPYQTPPTSPGTYSPYAQSPIARPIIAAPRSNTFMCCEYMLWVQCVSVILLVCFGTTLIYFIGIFSSDSEKVAEETHKCEDYHFMDESAYDKSNSAHLICGAGAAGTFGWLVPLLVLNVLDVVNASFLKKLWMFRISAVVWAAFTIAGLIILVGFSVVLFLRWNTFWRFFSIVMILILLWVFLSPGLMVTGIYAYALYRVTKILHEPEKPVNAAVSVPNVATPAAATPNVATPNAAPKVG